MKESYEANKFVIATVIASFIGSLTLISLAFFIPSITLENTQQATVNTSSNAQANLTISETTSAITLSNAYPMSDDAGKQTTPYTFTLTNNDTTKSIKYEMYLETYSTNTLSDSLIMCDLGAGVLTSNQSVTPTSADFSNSYLLLSETLTPKASNTYNLHIWVKSTATLANAQNKTWAGKISIKATYI